MKRGAECAPRAGYTYRQCVAARVRQAAAEVSGRLRPHPPSLNAPHPSACSQLRKVLLSWAVKVTDAGVCALVAAGAPLEILSLHGVKGVSDVAIDALADHCAGTLVALDVRGCIHVAGRAPDALCARLPRLRTFVLHT